MLFLLLLVVDNENCIVFRIVILDNIHERCPMCLSLLFVELLVAEHGQNWKVNTVKDYIIIIFQAKVSRAMTLDVGCLLIQTFVFLRCLASNVCRLSTVEPMPVTQKSTPSNKQEILHIRTRNKLLYNF
jgi:hypothetical protein